MKTVPSWPYHDESEARALERVLNSASWWRNAGTEVKQFEQEFSAYHDCIGGTSLTNGTAALELALKALNIGEGDEVIVPAFTFYSTISAVLTIGAVPVLADVSRETFCITLDEIRNAVTPRTKAVIVVHMAGNIAQMDEINAFAKERGIFVIEDAAHAHGASYKGRKAGSLSDCSTFSFQNAKLMTAGEGGMILSNDPEILHNTFLLSNCGREENDTTYQHVMVATNARLGEFQGAVLRAQLSRLDAQHALRKRNYAILSNLLTRIPGIHLQAYNMDEADSSHYMVMLYCDKEFLGSKTRDDMVQWLRANQIPCNRAFQAIQRLPILQTLDAGKWHMAPGTTCENAAFIADNVFCIHHNVLLGDEELMGIVADVIERFRSTPAGL